MAGDATDWSYASAGIEWSYSAELRDTGTVSYILALRRDVSLTESCFAVRIPLAWKSDPTHC